MPFHVRTGSRSVMSHTWSQVSHSYRTVRQSGVISRPRASPRPEHFGHVGRNADLSLELMTRYR